MKTRLVMIILVMAAVFMGGCAQNYLRYESQQYNFQELYWQLGDPQSPEGGVLISYTKKERKKGSFCTLRVKSLKGSWLIPQGNFTMVVSPDKPAWIRVPPQKASRMKITSTTSGRELYWNEGNTILKEFGTCDVPGPPFFWHGEFLE